MCQSVLDPCVMSTRSSFPRLSFTTAQHLGPHLIHMFEFLATVYSDPERSDNLLRSMIGLIGDLADSFPGGDIKNFLMADWIVQCLKEGRSSRQQSVTTKEVARWAKEMVKRATM